MSNATPPNAGWVGARRLLRQLRDIMAAPDSSQERLDRIATLIARELVAEVCSIYVRRAGDVLELFATEGLRADAVHNTRLMVGEGLVGFVAAQAMPVALADAQSHPLFAYRPETGEERYSSLMGVPILRGGRVLGVLVIQNRTQRNYGEEEIETLETTAMVLAEMSAGGEVLEVDESRYDSESAGLPLRLEGKPFSGGLTIGTALVHRPRVTIDHMLSEDAAEERERLRLALDALHLQLDEALERPEISGAGEHREVLETFRMFAEDRAGCGASTRRSDLILPRKPLLYSAYRRKPVPAGPGQQRSVARTIAGFRRIDQPAVASAHRRGRNRRYAIAGKYGSGGPVPGPGRIAEL